MIFLNNLRRPLDFSFDIQILICRFDFSQFHIYINTYRVTSLYLCSQRDQTPNLYNLKHSVFYLAF